MVDDGYLIGYEDGSGNFVEVGRFNNQAEDTNQPIEIVHSGSGEKVELGPSGFNVPGTATFGSVNTGVINNELLNYPTDSATLQAEIDGLTGTDKVITVPNSESPIEENITLPGSHHTVRAEPLQSGTAIDGGVGGHAVTTAGTDSHMESIAVNQRNATGEYDALNVTDAEFRAQNVSVDEAPRSAYRIENGADQTHIIDPEIAGGGSEAVYLGANFCHVRGVIAEQPPGDFIRLSSDAKANNVTGIANGAGQALDIAGGAGRNKVEIVANNCGTESDPIARIGGIGDKVDLTAFHFDVSTIDSTIVIDGFDCVIELTARQMDVQIDGDRNVVSGRANSLLADNGTDNDTSGLITV